MTSRIEVTLKLLATSPESRDHNEGECLQELGVTLVLLYSLATTVDMHVTLPRYLGANLMRSAVTDQCCCWLLEKRRTSKIVL